jgi:hypothetical protein
METKICTSCGRELPINNFKKGRWGRVSICTECDTKHRREKREERAKAAAVADARLLAEKRQLCLKDFTPRELMEELARRGYTGKLEYVETHVIDIANI